MYVESMCIPSRNVRLEAVGNKVKLAQGESNRILLAVPRETWFYREMSSRPWDPRLVKAGDIEFIIPAPGPGANGAPGPAPRPAGVGPRGHRGLAVRRHFGLLAGRPAAHLPAAWRRDDIRVRLDAVNAARGSIISDSS